MTTAQALWNGKWVIRDRAASTDGSFVPSPADLSALPPLARPLVIAMVGSAAATAGSARVDLADHAGNDAQVWIRLGLDRTAQVRITGSVAAPPAPPELPEVVAGSDPQFLDLTEEGLWVMDPDGRTAYVNQRMALMLGWDPQALTDRSLLSVVHGNDRSKVISLFAGRNDTRNPVRSNLRDIRLCSADGSIVRTQLSTNRILNDTGQTAAVVAVVTDASRFAAPSAVPDTIGADARGRPAEQGSEVSLPPGPTATSTAESVRRPAVDDPGSAAAPTERPADLSHAEVTPTRLRPAHPSAPPTTPSLHAIPPEGAAGRPTSTTPEHPLLEPLRPSSEATAAPGPAHQSAARSQQHTASGSDATAESDRNDGVATSAERQATWPIPSTTQHGESQRFAAADAYRVAFTHAPVGMAIIELDGSVRESNPAMAALLNPHGLAAHPVRLTELVGAEAQEELARQLADLRSGVSTSLRVEVPLSMSAESGTVWTLLSAAVVTDAEGKPAYAIAQAEDITERRVAEHDLVHQTLHDPLTGLGNRLLLRDELQHALSIADDVPFAVMFLDLDRFKSVNDTYGHDAGDDLLVGVAQRLRRIVRAADTVARFGGDEFAIVAQGIADREGVRILAEKIRSGLRAPFRVGDIDIATTASVGAVIGNRDYASGDQILRDADIAMYRAKDAGRDRHALFDDDIRLQEIERLEIERTIQAALDGDGLKLHYQPIIDLHTGRAVGAEALLRIADSNHTLLTPDAFLAVAEDSRLILDVGAWVLREVCMQLAAWSEAGFGHLAAWINVSGAELASPRFASLVQRSLSAQRIEPSRLHLECTEKALREAAPSTIEHLAELAAAGIAIGIDDFGSGYTSLADLRDLPVSFLKIDGGFTRRLDEPGGSSMVEAMVGLGRSLGLQIVAEGVESMTQMEALGMLGCDLAQGHLFAHPAPIDELALHVEPEARWP